MNDKQRLKEAQEQIQTVANDAIERGHKDYADRLVEIDKSLQRLIDVSRHYEGRQ